MNPGNEWVNVGKLGPGECSLCFVMVCTGSCIGRGGGERGLVGASPFTFTFRIFRVKVDSKVMGHL